MAAPPLLRLDDIRLTFGGTPLLSGAALSVSPGDRIALVGRNGSGKSTLLKIAAGLVEPQDGLIFRQPSATIRYLPQAPDAEGFATVRAYVEAGLGPADDPHRATYLIEHLGLTGEENPDTLSGGEARRAALARVLAPQPDILLLDEPTNHLDLQVIEWLEDELSRISSALVVISHDRRFLERVSRATVWLDRGETRRLDKGFAHFEAWRDTVLEEEERDQHKLGRQIVREEHWLRYGVTARRKRNMRRLGELQSMRQSHRTHRGAEGLAKITASEAQESGKLVIEAKGIGKSYDGRAVVRDFSIRIQRGDRVGLVGPNGAGKTTLLKMLTGVLAPDGGTVRLGVNLEIATLDQKREAVDPDETLAHYLTDGRGETVVVNGEERHVVSYMKDFLFKAENARTPVRELSGGERARLVLARVLARPSNLLVLDEPTNDLDMETLDLLQELVSGFPGTVLLVSHDRDFLDRTVTSTIAPEGDGTWTDYAGGYSDLLVQRGGAKLGEARREPKSTQPKSKDRAAQAAEPRASARKLSYKQKFALESLPARMAKTQGEIAALEAKLSDPALYARDPASFGKLAASADKARGELAAMEEEWLELEMLREELEAFVSAERFDVVVVGAGFTGLSAALALKEQGLSVLVLEARDRVGGRTETRINGLGEPVDTGGQFFCEDMPAMMALAERYGLVAIECAVEGDVAQRPPTDPGEPGGGSLFERSSALRERMNAADLDGPEGALTVADWIDRQDDQPQVVRKALRSTVEGLWCLPADGMPLWSLVEQDRRITNETWELQYALDIGMQGLAERLAVELGDGIRLTAPVTGIEHDAAGVRIHAGDIFVAARVLVAVPPVAAARIAFDPPLPDRLAKALAAWESGAVIKILLRYSEPFWRARGLSGMVAWRDPAGIFACEAPLKTGRPALVAFVGGPIATHWNTLGLDALKRWLLGELAAALGPQAAEPLDVHMRDWTDDRWSAGGYGDMVMRMDARDAEDVIRAGVGPIRFASSELSPSFPGYVEGAIVAGRAAATDSWR